MPLPLVPIGLASVGAGLASNIINGNPMDDVNKRIQEYMRQVQGRQAPQIGAAAQSGESGFRSDQRELVGRLDALSRGQGPSLAREQMRDATSRNMATQASIAQSGRGNAALANMTAANASGQLGAQAAADTAQLRVQEQLGALQQLGGVIGQGRGQDQENSQFNALQTNYRDQANLEAQLKAMGLNDQAIAQMLGLQAQGAQRPTMGDQLMGGGAGLLSMALQGGGKK